MDRQIGDLGHRNDDGMSLAGSAVALTDDHEYLLTRSEERLGLPERLFALNELDVLYDADRKALWTFMQAKGRPSFTPSMLAEFMQWQHLIARNFGPGRVPLEYLILGSHSAGVFCYGGDLELFAQLIEAGNRDGLIAYGNRCVEILNRNIHSLDLPIITVGLVQGAALGGGFEALLSFDFIIAERDATFGLPEVMFGLFPGMGAHPLLSRKLGTALADRMILSNETYTAQQMYDRGLVHLIAEPGEGVAAARDFVAKSQRSHAGMVAARRAMRISSPVEMAEFYAIVELWADAALQLSGKNLRLMHRLAAAQERKVKAA